MRAMELLAALVVVLAVALGCDRAPSYFESCAKGCDLTASLDVSYDRAECIDYCLAGDEE